MHIPVFFRFFLPRLVCSCTQQVSTPLVVPDFVISFSYPGGSYRVGYSNRIQSGYELDPVLAVIYIILKGPVLREKQSVYRPKLLSTEPQYSIFWTGLALDPTAYIPYQYPTAVTCSRGRYINKRHRH